MTRPAAPAPMVAFIGLGAMGLPMASRLIGAGFRLRGSDLSATARADFALAGGDVYATPREAAAGADILITMLPTGSIVRDALLGAETAAAAMRGGGLVIDMSSSAPLATRALGDELSRLGLSLIDAPVSGGVKRATDGTLAIMVGGAANDVERARPLLEAMGKTVTVVGGLGAGHAVKALNNYVSAAGLAAACEAAIVGRAFGIDTDILVDVLNVSTGRNNSTELKMKPFVLSGTFASGFSMALMAKDLRTAADLADRLGVGAAGMKGAAELWTEALAALGPSADHTEIYRFLEAGFDPATDAAVGSGGEGALHRSNGGAGNVAHSEGRVGPDGTDHEI